MVIAMPSSHRARANRALMIGVASVLFVIAVISGIIGFGGFAFAAIALAKIVFFVCMLLFAVSLLIAVTMRP